MVVGRQGATRSEIESFSANTDMAPPGSETILRNTVKINGIILVVTNTTKRRGVDGAIALDVNATSCHEVDN